MSRKPRVLVVAPWAPLPFDAGSRRVWTACRSLCDRYDFSLLTFAAPSPAAEAGRADARLMVACGMLEEARFLGGVFRRVHHAPRPDGPDPDRLDLPEDVRRFHSRAMREALERVVVDDEIDMVHVEFDLMSPYVAALRGSFPSLPCLLTHHDMGSVSFFHSYFREMTGWRRLLRLGEWRRRRAFTRDVCRRFDRVIMLTEADRGRLARLSPVARLSVVPTGVDLEHFSARPGREGRQPKTLVYVGHYPHYPNEDAALWFARETLPLLWREDSEIRFLIVGSGPTEALKELGRRDPRVVVTGKVPDVREHEEKAMVMVAPLRLGQGIKGKVLEGMAAGAPVVATSCANEGIRAEPERHILIADDPRAFRRQVLRLLGDAGLWERLSASGRAFVEERHSWKARAGQLDAVYKEVLKTSHQASKLVAR